MLVSLLRGCHLGYRVQTLHDAQSTDSLHITGGARGRVGYHIWDISFAQFMSMDYIIVCQTAGLL